MFKKIRRRFFSFSVHPIWMGTLTLFWIVGMMASTGCSQSQTDQGAQSGKPSGTVSPGNTGTGTLASEEEQKLPINPQDYKAMPIPSPGIKPTVKNGENPQEPSTHTVKPDEPPKETKQQ